MKLARDDFFVALYLLVIATMFAVFLIYKANLDPFGLQETQVIPVSADCLKLIAESDKAVVPLSRSEPEFKNIYSDEFIVLEFSITATGDVDWRTITVLQSSSPNLIAPAVAAVSSWQYCPSSDPQSAAEREGIRVQFSVTPPTLGSQFKDLLTE